MSTPSSAELQFASALSTHGNLAAATQEVCDRVAAKLTNGVDLAMLFVSSDLAEDIEQVAIAVRNRLGPIHLLGCTGEAIVGTAREVEGETALSLWAARLPNTTLRTMHLSFERSPEGGAIIGWPDDLPAEWPADSAVVMLGEPYSFPADALLERLNEDQPGVPVIGGMASGGMGPGENRVLLDANVFDEGAVAVMLHGGVRVRTVVSQGCRPIGRHFVITKAEQNVIYELGGRPALLQLKEIFDTLPTREQQLVQRGLHVGRVVSEYQDQFEQGDFLVRNVMGIDPDKGAVVITDFARVGQTVQFHIRDDQTADEDLRQMLTRAKQDAAAAPSGGLLFTCNGRGTRLFREPHHDAHAIEKTLGDIPLAGFFAAGELGPVGGKNFMHGFTASLALFEKS